MGLEMVANLTCEQAVMTNVLDLDNGHQMS